MHELGILYYVVKQVLHVVEENDLQEVDALVLQIGELSSVVPRYMHACWPAAVDGTLLEKTKLEIEELPANALCKGCGKVHALASNPDCCPFCGGQERALVGGDEFLIKEIRAC